MAIPDKENCGICHWIFYTLSFLFLDVSYNASISRTLRSSELSCSIYTSYLIFQRILHIVDQVKHSDNPVRNVFLLLCFCSEFHFLKEKKAFTVTTQNQLQWQIYMVPTIGKTSQPRSIKRLPN